jgi:tetratricopeptide (TPR) repeat protein
MRLDDDDRSFRVKKSEGWPVLATALAITVAVAAVIPELREYARGLVLAGGEAIGVSALQDKYAAAYKHLKIPSFPAKLLASSKISENLARLAREPCDRTAIAGLGGGLVAAHESRKAAEAYIGFAGLCPNSDHQLSAAAIILLSLSDSAKVVALTDDLIARNPTNARYRYLRGQALANLKQYAEALQDYQATIELQKNPVLLRERLFIEMANIYVAMGRPCDAAASMLAFVKLDLAKRNTPGMHKMIEEYLAKGCAQLDAPETLKRL